MMSIQTRNGRFAVHYCMLLSGAVAVSLIGLLWHVQALAFENEPKSFRGITWLTSASEARGLKLLDKTGDTDIRPHDLRQIGAASIVRIKYLFEKSSARARDERHLI